MDFIVIIMGGAISPEAFQRKSDWSLTGGIFTMAIERIMVF
jgi:hypothetical protein